MCQFLTICESFYSICMCIRTMLLLVFVVLAGTAVRCDDASNNYYVIEMPDEETLATKATNQQKTFNVYWNVPTMQCKSKKIPFTDLYNKYGIIQNTNDSFRGEQVAILYDPGLFPALLKNETSGKLKFRNGGVPQEGNITEHLETFRATMEQSIPDKDFAGIGIIDFESWRPIFRQNFGVLTPYKDVSLDIEKKNHWWWPKTWIQNEAKVRYEEAARVFMQTTVSVAKQMRPKARWGYYGFPYCFNMASSNMQEKCANNVPRENNQIYWLWAESSALYPSVYSSKSLTTKQLTSLVRGRVNEAARVRRNGSPILPYFWFRYRDGGFLSETDLQAALKTLYQSSASGLIIWGSSSDVNTVAKCNKLLNYVEKTLGPAIAKYVKTVRKFGDDSTTEFTTYNTDKSTTDMMNTDKYNSTTDVNTASTTYKPLQTGAQTNETESTKSQTDDLDTSYEILDEYDSTIEGFHNTSTTNYQSTEYEDTEETESLETPSVNQTNDQIITKQYNDTAKTTNNTSVTYKTTPENTSTTEKETSSSQTEKANTNNQFDTPNTVDLTNQSETEVTNSITTPSGEENINSQKETTFIDMLLNALSNSKMPVQESNSIYSTAAPSVINLIGTSNEPTNKFSTSSPIFDTQEIKDLTLSDIILNGNTQNIKQETSSLEDDNTNDGFVEYTTDINKISSASGNISEVFDEETDVTTDISSSLLSLTSDTPNISTTTDDFEDFVTYSELESAVSQKSVANDYNTDPNVNEITTDDTYSDFNNDSSLVTEYNETEYREVNTEANDLVSSEFIVSYEPETTTDTVFTDITNDTSTLSYDVDYLIVNEGNNEVDSSQSSENPFTIDSIESSTDKSSSDLYDVTDYLTQMHADTSSLSEKETTKYISSSSTNSLDKVVVYIL